MKYIVKDQNDNLMIMTVTNSSIPSIPDLEVLGLESELNPNSIDLSKLSWDGEALVEDADKVLAFRQAKANKFLDDVRALRSPLLDEADKTINTLEDDGLDAAAYRVYRKALRECTDEYKKVNGDAKLLCEDLVASEFVFPSLQE